MLPAAKSQNEQRSIIFHQVDHALGLLTKYNDRLQQELKDRRRVKKMIADYLAAQKDLETQAEERLEQYRDKLEKVNSLRDDLKSHIQVTVQPHILQFRSLTLSLSSRVCQTLQSCQTSLEAWRRCPRLGISSPSNLFRRKWLKCIMTAICILSI